MSNQSVQLLEEKILRFVKYVQRRNTRETLLACFVIVVFALDLAYAIYSQRKDNLSIIGSSIVILASLLIIMIIRQKLHISKSEISAFPPLQFPDKWKHHLSNQARMLRLSWLWYLLPLFLGFCIYFVSVYDVSSGSIFGPLLLAGIVFALIWRLNLKVAKQIERDRDAWFSSSPARTVW
ncbi:hypothetical protein [Leptolyngbya ohadii]|uniref:hypothetical protein n=1 Tax=Leptolyngbya ohadii TaxID=1962290 RepID=UPI000B59F87B|nr:hypothetical protein [Leptolyngbya ohadii]